MQAAAGEEALKTVGNADGPIEMMIVSKSWASRKIGYERLKSSLESNSISGEEEHLIQSNIKNILNDSNAGSQVILYYKHKPY
jgi:hypothetical protein